MTNTVVSDACMLPFKELHTTCKDELTTQNTVKRMISMWLNYSDCMQPTCKTTNLNDMHLFGLGLCHILNTHDVLDCRAYDAAKELGEHCARLTNDIDIHNCTWGEMTQLAYSLQSTYADLLTYDVYTGYDCKVDVTYFILALMSRIGELMSNLYLWSSLSSEEQAGLSPYYEHESDGYHILKPMACVEVVDILHSIFRVVTLLMNAKPVGRAPERPDLNKFHHEASLDDFYRISTVMDCPPRQHIMVQAQLQGPLPRRLAGRVPPLPDVLSQRADSNRGHSGGQGVCCQRSATIDADISRDAHRNRADGRLHQQHVYKGQVVLAGVAQTHPVVWRRRQRLLWGEHIRSVCAYVRK